MNGNPIYEQLNRAHEFSQEAKDAKTAAEHTAIIRKYRENGRLDKQDRQDAIQKYMRFNAEHPEFCAKWNIVTTATNSNANINDVEDAVIVDNLAVQLAYLCGENVFGDGRRNG